jgi:glycosyl transferase family 87
MSAQVAAVGRWRRQATTSVAALGLVAVAVPGVVLAVYSAAGPSHVVPLGMRGYGFPGWLAGPFGGLVGSPLDDSSYGLLVLTMSLGYLLVVSSAGTLRTGPTLAVIALLHVVFMLTPPVTSTDLTNYVAYARLGALHGLSPYLHTVAAVPVDPSYVWSTWRHYRSPYGPVFTLLSYAVVPLGYTGAVWALKVLFTAAAAGCLALVWRIARVLGRPPLAAVAFVGLNPAWLFWLIGGGHNDSVMVLLVLASILLALQGRNARSGLVAVVAAGIKGPALLLLPFLALRARRPSPRLMLGFAAGGALVALVSAIAFDSVGAALSFHRQSDFASVQSVPGQVAPLFGVSVLEPPVRTLPAIALVLGLAACAVWTFRTRRWLAGYGWATAVLIATFLWELPWYVVWLIPVAALVRGPALRIAAVGLTLMLLWSHTPHAEVSELIPIRSPEVQCRAHGVLPCVRKGEGALPKGKPNPLKHRSGRGQ